MYVLTQPLKKKVSYYTWMLTDEVYINKTEFCKSGLVMSTFIHLHTCNTATVYVRHNVVMS